MSLQHNKNIESQRAASMLEYALVLAILLAALVVANKVLLEAVDSRSQSIYESHKSMIGCSSGVIPVNGDGCI